MSFPAGNVCEVNFSSADSNSMLGVIAPVRKAGTGTGAGLAEVQ